MTKEQKQIEFLNRVYVNIEHYKSLRIKLPITISSLIIAITAFVMNNDNIPKDNFQRILLIFVVVIICLLGNISYYYVHSQYKDLVEDIHHLWKRLGMTGIDFYKENKQIGMNPKQYATKIFFIGYLSIILMSIISILVILSK